VANLVQNLQFENAQGTVELMMRRNNDSYCAPFELLNYSVLVRDHLNPSMSAEAVVKLKVNGELFHTAAEGHGPVHALDMALRKALMPSYPSLANEATTIKEKNQRLSLYNKDIQSFLQKKSLALSLFWQSVL
jgi:hypothetical protein